MCAGARTSTANGRVGAERIHYQVRVTQQAYTVLMNKRSAQTPHNLSCLLLDPFPTLPSSLNSYIIFRVDSRIAMRLRTATLPFPIVIVDLSSFVDKNRHSRLSFAYSLCLFWTVLCCLIDLFIA
jgi:hypothetical protein